MAVAFNDGVGNTDHFLSALLSLLDGQILDLDHKWASLYAADLSKVHVVFRLRLRQLHVIALCAAL